MMVQWTTNADKQGVVSNVVSVGPAVHRVESVRESFRSKSSRVWAVSRRGELGDQPAGLDHGLTPIKSSNHSF